MTRRITTIALFILVVAVGSTAAAETHNAVHEVVRDADTWIVKTQIITLSQDAQLEFSAPLPGGSAIESGEFVRDTNGRIVGAKPTPWNRYELRVPARGEALPGFLLEDFGPQRVTFLNGRFEPQPGSNLQKYPGYLANPNFEKKIRRQFERMKEPRGSTTMYLAPSDISAGVPGDWTSDADARRDARLLFGGIAIALLALVGGVLVITGRMAKREEAEAFLREHGGDEWALDV